MEIPDKIFFKIGEVARILDVEPYVLRYWESEFHIKPKRSPAGQRLYRRDNVERLLEIKQLLHTEGYTIAGARRHLAQVRKEARAGRRQSEVSSGAGTGDAGSPVRGDSSAWHAALAAEVEGVRRLIREARQIEV